MDSSDGAAFPPLSYSGDRGAPSVPPRTLQYRVTTGRLSRLRAGVFVEPAEFAAAGRRRRELARIAAVIATRRGRVVLSHESAAAVWGIPRIGPAPESVELLDARGTRPRSMNGVAWRRTPFDPTEIVEVNGFLVTGLLQTVVDIACDRGFVNAVVALDAATGTFLRADGFVVARGVEPTEVGRRLGQLGRRGGIRGARIALEFADARAESVGESLSRAQMHLLGFPAPALQTEFDRADGGVDRVDFDWPDHGLFGEFDGDLKYLDPRYRGGRTAEQVVLDEKKRDQRIARRHRRHGVHWDWRIATRPPELAAALEDAGLPCGTHRRRP
ncbi:hypothetical protein [Agromyces neolithicus]|uniref:Transcriptional regulator, AbiEi antitoxin, Type IV TA system n=1 Tax=Agromyces neolithicus TaxID=269420 RepID=A0ABP4Y7X2_9MICO